MSIPEKIIERIGPAVLLPIPSGEKGPKLAGWQKLTLADMTPDHLDSLNHGNNIGVLLKAGGRFAVGRVPGGRDADSDLRQAPHRESL